MTKLHLLGPLLADDKLIEATANLLGRGEPPAEVRPTPPRGLPGTVFPVKTIPAAGNRNPNHVDPPHGARGRALPGGLPWLAPDLRRLPVVRPAGPAVGGGVRGSGGGTGEAAVLLLLLAPEEGPRAAERAGAVAAALLLLPRGAARVDTARGGERRRRGAGADGG